MIKYLLAIIGALNLVLWANNFVEVLRIEMRTQQALKDLEVQNGYIKLLKSIIIEEAPEKSKSDYAEDSNRNVRTSLFFCEREYSTN